MPTVIYLVISNYVFFSYSKNTQEKMRNMVSLNTTMQYSSLLGALHKAGEVIYAKLINSRIYHYIILIDIPSMLGNTIRSFFLPGELIKLWYKPVLQQLRVRPDIWVGIAVS